MARSGLKKLQSRATTAELLRLETAVQFGSVQVEGRFVRFYTMLALSTVIATYGLMDDSTAAVIGAMIIAPLMTPIMAATLSIVRGDMVGLRRSLAVVVSGIAMVVGIAYLLTLAVPNVLDLTSVGQVTARTSPGLTDLAIALASGAAGAFGLSRSDVSDALPGVAISISLVPPLGVVGICLGEGSLSLALGALTLFTTNLLAILLAGGVVFAILGFGHVDRPSPERTVARRLSTGIVIAAVLLIAIPLTASTVRLTQNAILVSEFQSVLDEWLTHSAWEVTSVTSDLNSIDAVVQGPGTQPSRGDLYLLLRDSSLFANVDVNVHLRGEDVYYFEAKRAAAQ